MGEGLGLILFLIVFLFYLPVLIFNDKNRSREVIINVLFFANLVLFLASFIAFPSKTNRFELNFIIDNFNNYLFSAIIFSLIFNLSLYLTRLCFFIEKVPLKIFQIIVSLTLLCLNLYFIDYSLTKYFYANNAAVPINNLFYISLTINFFIITALLGLFKSLHNNYALFTWNTFGFVLSIIFYFYVSPDEQNFDSTLWHRDENKRYSMLNNLIEKEKLIGKSKIEVISLLDTTACKQFVYSNDSWYYIISKPGFTFITDIPTTWLTVSFKDDKVIKVEKDD